MNFRQNICFFEKLKINLPWDLYAIMHNSYFFTSFLHFIKYLEFPVK